MKVKALIPFAGEVSMAVGEVADIPDNIANDLISAGHVEKIGGKDKPAPAPKEETEVEKPKAKRPAKK